MAKTATSCWQRGSEGRVELGWFTTGYLPQAHPTRLLFLIEISEGLNAYSLLPLTPIPGGLGLVVDGQGVGML